MKISTFTVVRIDTGTLTSICIFLNHSGTIVVRIVYDIPSESLFFALSSDIVFMEFGQRIFKISYKVKAVLSLLFFEQGYLGDHSIYQAEVFSMFS